MKDESCRREPIHEYMCTVEMLGKINTEYNSKIFWNSQKQNKKEQNFTTFFIFQDKLWNHDRQEGTKTKEVLPTTYVGFVARFKSTFKCFENYQLLLNWYSMTFNNF